MENNITVFVDSVGRMIVGSVIEEGSTETNLKVNNPSIIQIQPDQQTGNISVQFLPYIFSEFVQESNRNNVSWDFPKSSIVTSDNIALDDRVVQQYLQIVSGQGTAVQQPPVEEPEVIKLFDEDE